MISGGGQQKPVDGVAAIHTLLFRPEGGSLYAGSRWNGFQWPSPPPRFVVIHPEITVVLSDRRLLHVRVPAVPADRALVFDGEQTEFLATVIRALGGTATKSSWLVMAPPVQPTGGSIAVMRFLARAFPLMPGHWAGWEFYVKPNMPSSAPVALSPSDSPGTAPAGGGFEEPLPTLPKEQPRPDNRNARLGADERRLVDSNVMGFFPSGSTTGLIVRIEFRRPVNLAGIREGRILEARDEAGRSIGTLSGISTEIRTSDDPTGAMSVRLFIRGTEAAQTSPDLRMLVLQLGPATIRAKYDKALFSR